MAKVGCMGSDRGCNKCGNVIMNRISVGMIIMMRKTGGRSCGGDTKQFRS